MEASDYFQGGCNRVGTPQFAVEKQGKAGGDHFIVEDLLDLSNEEDDAAGQITGVDGGSEAAAGFSSTDSSTVTAVDSCSNCVSGGPDSHFSGELDCRSLAGISGDLCEPYDELAELEWLSNFVEESFSSEDLQKLQLMSGPKISSLSASHGYDSTSQAPQPPLFCPEAPVPGKARSKRSRVAPCNWTSRLLLLSSTSTTSSSSDSKNALLLHRNTGKKASKEDTLPPSADGRKCLHCGTDKTPQWRTGPIGPKTLCNACGVRYKSGRLVPEYRPAASPTFVLSKHSNSHRKVLELRRQKEMQQRQQQQQQQMLIEEPVAVSGDDFLIHHHPGPDFRQLI